MAAELAAWRNRVSAAACPPDEAQLVFAAHPSTARPDEESSHVMKRNLLVTAGGLITVLGLLFILQGTGLVKGSLMTNSHFWIYGGAVIAIAGAAILMLGVRTPRAR